MARCTNVVPQRLIISLTTTVVMISRRSGWLVRSSENRSDMAEGKYAASDRVNHGSSGSDDSAICRLRLIFV
jgi:hypothetical protein